VIRYFLKYDNEEEFYRALCILFLPFRNERFEIHKKNVKILYEENMQQIEKERGEFEKHRGMVEIIKEVEKSKDTNNDLEEDDENEYIEEEKISKMKLLELQQEEGI